MTVSKNKSKKFVITPSQSIWKYVSENRPGMRGLTLLSGLLIRLRLRMKLDLEPELCVPSPVGSVHLSLQLHQLPVQLPDQKQQHLV